MDREDLLDNLEQEDFQDFQVQLGWMASLDRTDRRETWVSVALKDSKGSQDSRGKRVYVETTHTGSGVLYSPVWDNWPHRAGLERRDPQDLQDPPELQGHRALMEPLAQQVSLVSQANLEKTRGSASLHFYQD